MIIKKSSRELENLSILIVLYNDTNKIKFLCSCCFVNSGAFDDYTSLGPSDVSHNYGRLNNMPREKISVRGNEVTYENVRPTPGVEVSTGASSTHDADMNEPTYDRVE